MAYLYDSISKRVCCVRVCTSACLSQTHITKHGLLTHNCKPNTTLQYKMRILGIGTSGSSGLTSLVYTAAEQEAIPNKLGFEDH